MLAVPWTLGSSFYGIIYTLMGKSSIFALILFLVGTVQASWYWPFGSSDDDGQTPQRLSVLMKPASLLIDEASELAAEGKVDESVEKYRKALLELDRIEMENPERSKTTEFATVRNKRAYVNAAIDSMLLSQVKANAKAVAVSDTTELEKKLAEEKQKRSRPSQPAQSSQYTPTKREQAMDAIAKGDFAVAEGLISEMLTEKPSGAMALNLKATLEIRQGKLKEAEATLDRAISTNPRNYHAYYNMAMLLLQKGPDGKDAARRYYETGRAMGNGPKDEQLEALFR